jgi:hypothetical protein
VSKIMGNKTKIIVSVIRIVSLLLVLLVYILMAILIAMDAYDPIDRLVNLGALTIVMVIIYGFIHFIFQITIKKEGQIESKFDEVTRLLKKIVREDVGSFDDTDDE